MAHVIVLDSVNEDIFVCGFCKTVFNSLQLFLDHKRLESLEAKSDVAVMRQNYTESNYLSLPQNHENTPCINLHDELASRLHILADPSSVSTQNEMLKGSKVCNICKKSFKNDNSYKLHIRSHEKLYQCYICGRCFWQNSHLNRHIMSHRVWPNGLKETTAKTSEAELLSYSCPHCDVILTDYRKFRAHIKNHSALKKFKCIQGKCIGLFEDIESLLNHISAIHDFCIYSCHKCYTTFNSLADIAKHHQNNCTPKANIGKNQFKCAQCDATFKKTEKLTLHMLTESHRNTCIHCHKTFSSDKRLRLHLQIHRKLKPFQCNICQRAFNVKKYLSVHMLRHSEIKFICSICNSNFKRKDSLQRHVRIHEDKKKYKCPFSETLGCKMEFCRSDKLKSHVKCHTKHMTVKIKGPRKTKSGC